ncbi:hypothetical protein CQ018_08360 [Arthrobacter sp. MYb227]|uniref:hypothetical protein n=1 Tax=Arthrobacter sp. MYb227 TaxID=1848601 RepID=UPI000CFCCC6C|nr:hypothetical protein [Arthrobacter sp. MYb227]PQZ93665.1 hypothetical protein CQ018_08360 [Arthrobacter sp. MYb227]
MRHTSGQQFGTLFAPLLLRGVLAGMVVGLVLGSAMTIQSMIEAANDPELWAGWGPWGYGPVPLLYGTFVGGVMALVPLIGAFLALYVHSGIVPLPSVNQQARAACYGGTAASMIPAIMLMVTNDEGAPAVIYIAVGFVLVSSLITFVLTRRFLGRLKRHEELTIRVTRETV